MTDKPDAQKKYLRLRKNLTEAEIEEVLAVGATLVPRQNVDGGDGWIILPPDAEHYTQEAHDEFVRKFCEAESG